MEGENSSSNPMELASNYWTENEMKQELYLFDEATNSCLNVKEETISQFDEEIKTENEFSEVQEDTGFELEASCSQEAEVKPKPTTATKMDCEFNLDDETVSFLQTCQLKRNYEDTFKDAMLDMPTIALLDKSDIEKLIKPLGEQIRFICALKNYVREHNMIESPFYMKSLSSAVSESSFVDISNSSVVIPLESGSVISQDSLLTSLITSGHDDTSTSSGHDDASTTSGHDDASTTSGHDDASTTSGHGDASTSSGHDCASSKMYIKNFMDQMSKEKILEVIGNTLKGISILRRTENGAKALCIPEQNFITAILVEFAIKEFSSDFALRRTPFIFEALAQKITEAFPLECTTTYFVPATHDALGQQVTRYRGKLFEKFYNIKGKRNRIFKVATTTKRRKKTTKEQAVKIVIKKRILEFDLSLAPDDDEETYEENQVFLKNLNVDWEIVVDKWKATSNRRLREIYSLDPTEDRTKDVLLTVNAITSKWPILKHPRAYKLLQLDFSNLYKSLEDSIFTENWIRYKVNLVDLMLKEVKDKTVLKSLLLSKSVENFSDGLLLATIPYLFRPYNIKFGWRPTTVEAQEGFYSLTENSSGLPLIVENRRSRLALHGQRLQPFVVAVGLDYNDINKHYVVIDDYNYMIDTQEPIEAMDICMKCIHALGASYDQEAQRSWMFLQKCFYKLSLTAYDFVDSRIQHFINQIHHEAKNQ